MEALCPKYSDMLDKVKKQEEKDKYAAGLRSQEGTSLRVGHEKEVRFTAVSRTGGQLGHRCAD